MKMTIKEALDIYMALCRMSNAILPGTVALKLFENKNKIEAQRKFYEEEEKKYIKEFGGECDENGKITFTDKDKSVKYMAKVNELLSVEIDIDLHHAGTVKADDISLSMHDIEVLKDVVSIE